MQQASGDTVLGDFANREFDYHGVRSRFFRDGDGYFIETDNADGELAVFRIVHVFGVEPLQQYLVAAPDGRLQALPFAWDTRSAEEGGQRWFHLYPDEPVRAGDRLHWTGIDQNWNYMCAECHSTDLRMNYDAASDSFATTYSEIDVGCEACHGPGSLHIARAQGDSLSGGTGLVVDLDDRGGAVWRMDADTGIASRSELAMRPPQQPEACGRCHARRGLIASDYEYGRPLAHTHRPSLLHEPLYFADGQINDEVYVYGSFLQSRMYRAGVTCSDCHNPHSLELITGADPDAVCAQCHLPARFASPEHHGHADDDAGCVDCHMPDRIYMAVDARRDHSLRIPRPDLTLATGSPNPCNVCHADRDAAWAMTALRAISGDAGEPQPHFATAVHAARAGHANGELRAAIEAVDTPGIARATALSLLAHPLGRGDVAAVHRGLRDADPLVRLGALEALRRLPAPEKARLGAPLLADPVRGVRIQAAFALAPSVGWLSAAAQDEFRAAADEYRAAQRAIAMRPEAHASLGGLEAALGNFDTARAHYLRALEIEPRAVEARANLADLLRRAGDDSGGEALLRAGLELDPQSAPLRHSLGLLLIRRGQPDAAFDELRRAMRLAPDNGRYVYVVGVALNSLGERAAAIETLEAARQRFPTDYDILWALATMYRDRGAVGRAREIAAELAAHHPDDRNVAALSAALGEDQ